MRSKDNKEIGGAGGGGGQRGEGRRGKVGLRFWIRTNDSI